MNYGSLLTNVYTRKKLGHITQHQSRAYHTNDVILTNHRVCTMMTLHKAEGYILGQRNPEIPIFHPTANSFQPALAVGAGYNFKVLSCEAAHLSPQFPCLSIKISYCLLIG